MDDVVERWVLAGRQDEGETTIQLHRSPDTEGHALEVTMIQAVRCRGTVFKRCS